MKFIGREKELKELNNRYNSKNKEFGIIYGRRRIGKSSLINEFLKDKNAILFQAKKDNAFGNLKSFSFAINNKLNLPKNYIFSSWEEAFDALKNHEKNHRFILAIDEYPYIIEQDSSFSSIIQEFIDRVNKLLGKRVKKIILYGSYARGDYNENSDIDIMILTDLTNEEIIEYRELVSNIAFDIEFDTNFEVMISPLVKNIEKFEYWLKALPFYMNVQREGVVLSGAENI